jgi:hypothetical protein
MAAGLHPSFGRAGSGGSGEFSGLVIEGQPQQRCLQGWGRGQFSGLVIEGQPQLGREGGAGLISLAVW